MVYSFTKHIIYQHSFIFGPLYHCLYAYRGLRISLTPSDWLTAISYQIVALIIALYLMDKSYTCSRTKTLITCSISTTMVLLLSLLCTMRSIIPGAPRLPSRYVFYASPFILVSPLATLGYGLMKEEYSKWGISSLLAYSDLRT